MNTDIQIFNNADFGEVRVINVDGAPWFVAADVCRALELGNTSQALVRLDDDEKNTIILNEGIAGNPSKAIVSEAGLYTLILSSRKPNAKLFKRWITHEVIPSIRKHGVYATGDFLSRSIADPAWAIGVRIRRHESQPLRIVTATDQIIKRHVVKVCKSKEFLIDRFTFAIFVTLIAERRHANSFPDLPLSKSFFFPKFNQTFCDAHWEPSYLKKLTTA